MRITGRYSGGRAWVVIFVVSTVCKCLLGGDVIRRLGQTVEGSTSPLSEGRKIRVTPTKFRFHILLSPGYTVPRHINCRMSAKPGPETNPRGCKFGAAVPGSAIPRWGRPEVNFNGKLRKTTDHSCIKSHNVPWRMLGISSYTAQSYVCCFACLF